MKHSRLFLFILAGAFLLTMLGASPSHAVLIKITDGSYTPFLGDTRSISGYVDVTYWPPRIITFGGFSANFYIEGLPPILSDAGYLEYQFPFQDRAEVIFLDYEEYDYAGRSFYGTGTVFYDKGRYEVSDYHPFYNRVWDPRLRSLELDIQYDYATNPYQYDRIHLVAQTPVPEPATMMLLASGLVGLAGLRKKFTRS